MQRRDFLKSGLAATGAVGFSSLGKAHADNHDSEHEHYELRHWHIPTAQKKAVVDRFLKNAVMPAAKRINLGPIGVFHSADHPKNNKAEQHDIWTLTPFRNAQEFFSRDEKIVDDAFIQNANEYLNSQKTDAAYTRITSSFMRAFDGKPKLEIPLKGKRIFELREYQSHNELKALLKMQMFNEGEIAIFNATGLKSVFFGQTLIGPDIPNLTYMLVYENQEIRGKNWQAFLKHPNWDRMKNMEIYKDTVSKIVARFLDPAPYSQV